MLIKELQEETRYNFLYSMNFCTTLFLIAKRTKIDSNATTQKIKFKKENILQTLR